MKSINSPRDFQVSGVAERPRGGRVLSWIGRAWLRLAGWKLAGGLPEGSKFLLIAAPHTSAWDFPFGMAVGWAMRLKFRFIAKDSLFRWPFGWLMRAMGGIPVDRSTRQGMVEQVARRFRDAESLLIVISPPGSRSKGEHWKSGFYWMAKAAQVPIVCGYMDYGRKEAGFGLAFIPTGDLKADMDRIRAFYDGKLGKRPENMTPVRLAEESE